MIEIKSFVGQPVLSQILNCIPTATITKCCRKNQSNRYYKKLPVRVHLLTLLYGVLSYCNGLVVDVSATDVGKEVKQPLNFF